MNKQILLRSIITMFIICMTTTSCAEDDIVEIIEEEIAEAEPGQLTCKIDGNVFTNGSTGYVMDDNHSFVKAENGEEQLSIDFYGMYEGEYTVSGEELDGNAKLYFYPADEENTVYVSQSGLFTITNYQTIGGFKVSGTFSGTFEKFINIDEPTGIMIEVTNGSFTDVTLFDVR